jgi:hypothetical protein
MTLLARPAGRLMSAKECKLRRDAWNKCIDDYIALGTDTRSQEEIELTVKLGINLGAYLPKCERKGCPNRAAWKDQDSIKFRRCGKCKCVICFSFAHDRAPRRLKHILVLYRRFIAAANVRKGHGRSRTKRNVEHLLIEGNRRLRRTLSILSSNLGLTRS